jgi:hypothetical protein
MNHIPQIVFADSAINRIYRPDFDNQEYLWSFVPQKRWAVRVAAHIMQLIGSANMKNETFYVTRIFDFCADKNDDAD